MFNPYAIETIVATRIHDFQREAETDRLARTASRRAPASQNGPDRISRLVAAMRAPFTMPAPIEPPYMPRLVDYPFKHDAV